MLQAELQRRTVLDSERAWLLERAGARLDVAPAALTLTMVESLMDPVSAETARARSSELRGLLEELQREHYVNRVLMNQELRFLDHLLRLADGDGVGYGAAGDRRRTPTGGATRKHRAFDLEA
jgi:hypothetical protein